MTSSSLSFKLCLTAAGEPRQVIDIPEDRNENENDNDNDTDTDIDTDTKVNLNPISDNCGFTIQDLCQMASRSFGGRDCVDLKCGFPPKSLLKDHDANHKMTLVRSILKRNDLVTVVLAPQTQQQPENQSKEKRNAANTKSAGQNKFAQAADVAAATSTASSSGDSRRSQRAASKVATESFSDVIKAQDKLIKEQKQQASKNSKRKRPINETLGTTSISSPQKKSAVSSSAAVSRKLAKLTGRRLGDGEEVAPIASRQRQSTTGASSRNKPKLTSAEDISFALMNALQSGSGGGGKVGQVLRLAMRNAMTRQYDVTRAVTRVSAVQAGKYRIEQQNSLSSSSSSSLVVYFEKGLEGRGEFQEVVDSIPREALELVLKGIHASDPESLRTHMLAQLSPRVFWSLLKEMSTTAETCARSTDVALQALLPTLDWTFLRRRKQTLSEKAKENLRQAKLEAGDANESGGAADLDAAAEAIQAVEDAMEQLQHHDQTQRRNRAAQAALSRFGSHHSNRSDDVQEPGDPSSISSWRLVTPAEDDVDELMECTGGNQGMASKLMELGICNWRQLANADSKKLTQQLQKLDADSKDTTRTTVVDEDTVDSWVDRAQQESIDEIIVEICDGRLDVVEVLTSDARSGTPKDLASWRNIPELLLESASTSLGELGVSVSDLAIWCERANAVLQEYEWMSWYATPVE